LLSLSPFFPLAVAQNAMAAKSTPAWSGGCRDRLGSYNDSEMAPQAIEMAQNELANRIRRLAVAGRGESIRRTPRESKAAARG
jgi:hypothetical protein